MRRKRTVIAALVLMTAFCSRSYAGTWENQDGRWYYENDDGTRPSEEWLWLDGNGDGFAECYYFDSSGYMYSGETTPDGYWVNDQAHGRRTTSSSTRKRRIRGIRRRAFHRCSPLWRAAAGRSTGSWHLRKKNLNGST